MNYPLLGKLYYKSKSEYETEYLSRFNSISSIKFDISINENPAFLITTPELLDKAFEISTLNTKLEILINQLPTIALNQYIKRCLINEISLTNEIEGIISTRREISEIIEHTQKTKKQKRLSGLINKYLKLDKKETLNIKTCQDIRQIYDDLLWEEILADEPKNLPDGIYFRKEGVNVLSDFKKIIHEGVMPEEKINLLMLQALNILNDEKINILIRIAIFHYLFGYIHPFYDGNGRVSRFISSYLLSQSFNTLTGYSLAYTIKENITSYYKSFKITNEQKNKGDLTPFVINFFDILINMLENLNNTISEKYELLDYYYELSQKLSNGNETESKIIFILFQETIFGNNGLSISTLVTASETSEYKVRQVINQLNSSALLTIVKFGKKPFYSFNLDKIRELSLD